MQFRKYCWLAPPAVHGVKSAIIIVRSGFPPPSALSRSRSPSLRVLPLLLVLPPSEAPGVGRPWHRLSLLPRPRNFLFPASSSTKWTYHRRIMRARHVGCGRPWRRASPSLIITPSLSPRHLFPAPVSASTPESRRKSQRDASQDALRTAKRQMANKLLSSPSSNPSPPMKYNMKNCWEKRS